MQLTGATEMREIAPASDSDSQFRFQRVVLLEFAYAKDAEANNAAVLVHPLHHSVILCLAHVSRRIREDDFEEVDFRVELQFHFLRHYERNHADCNSRTWLTSHSPTGRISEASTVGTAIVLPANVTNSTSYATPLPWM